MDVVEDGPVVHGDEEEEEDEAVPDGDDDEDNVVMGADEEDEAEEEVVLQYPRHQLDMLLEILGLGNSLAEAAL